MPNGNLWDSLHKGKIMLDWPTRHQIALGVAQGLAYLHHDLMPPIIHRDIKSTDILLDVNYHAKVADFGIAKVLRAQGVKDSTTTVIAGTYGYLAPEYAYSSKATTIVDGQRKLLALAVGASSSSVDLFVDLLVRQKSYTMAEPDEGRFEVLDYIQEYV